MTQVEPDDELYRRILHFHRKPDGSVSSAAFMAKGGRQDPDVSVYLARLSNPHKVLKAGVANQLLASLQASVPLGLGLSVRLDPMPDFPGHCVITDFGQSWKQQCSQLAAASKIVNLDT